MTSGQNVQILPMLTGDCASDIGTGSAAAVLLVTALLVILGVTDILIPISAVIFFVIVLILFGGHGWNPVYLGAHICGGGFLFLASFCATDYTTSPVTIRGRALYGALFGVLTAAARLRLGFDENGALFALLIMNLLARPIDRITMPRPFGSPQKRTITVIDNKRKS
jgi:Na+-translocating ferredoxin:NAD+ oxidoreductase RnfD subunit